MDVRELLIANAPKDIPEWFKPKMKISKPRPTAAMISMTKEERKKINDCRPYYQDIARLFGEDAINFIEMKDDITEAIIDWFRTEKLEKDYEDEYNKERLTQWPSAYADMVIERSK